MWHCNSFVPVGPLWELSAGADALWQLLVDLNCFFSFLAFSFPLSDHRIRSCGLSCPLHVWLVTVVSNASAGTELCHLPRTAWERCCFLRAPGRVGGFGGCPGSDFAPVLRLGREGSSERCERRCLAPLLLSALLLLLLAPSSRTSLSPALVPIPGQR